MAVSSLKHRTELIKDMRKVVPEPLHGSTLGASPFELHLDEGDLNRTVRDVRMNVLHAVNRERIRTAVPNRL
jgi:hypothetical protein